MEGSTKGRIRIDLSCGVRIYEEQGERFPPFPMRGANDTNAVKLKRHTMRKRRCPMRGYMWTERSANCSFRKSGEPHLSGNI